MNESGKSLKVKLDDRNELVVRLTKTTEIGQSCFKVDGPKYSNQMVC